MTVASRQSLPAQLAAAIPSGIERFRADDRAAWLAMRQADVTASVIAALIGEHPYMTRFGLYALKTGQIADVEVDPVVTGASVSLPPMLRGTVLEPVAPTLVRMLRPGWLIEPCGWYYRDAAVRIGATPDFVAFDPDRSGVGSIQVKTTDGATFRKIWRTDDGLVEPPLFIVVQAIVEAVLTGASWAEVAVLVTGATLDLHLVPIPLHIGVMDRLRAETAVFWRAVDRQQPPEVDYGRDADVLAAMYRDDNGREIDLTSVSHLPELLERRGVLKSEIKVRSEEVEAIDAEFKARIGPNEAALIAGNRCATWRIEHRRHRFVPQSETRVLRFSSVR